MGEKRQEPKQSVNRRGFLRLLGLAGALAACRDEATTASSVGRDAESAGESNAGHTTPDGSLADAPANSTGEYASAGDASLPNPSNAAAGDCEITTPDVLGPFYEAGAPSRAKIVADEEPGERLTIRGTVYGPDCTTPLGGVLLDVWQADAGGNYHVAGESGYRLRGTLMTDPDGGYEIDTIVPGSYALQTGPRPAHVHFQVRDAAHQTLTTQLYFEGDPFLAPNDGCGSGCNSDEPDRIVALSGQDSRSATFDIVLALA